MKGAALALLVLALSGCAAGARGEHAPGSIDVSATPVPLYPADPSDRRAGAFTYAGGLWLKSPGTSAFGGFSDLKVLDPQGDFVSESDEGSLLRARLVLDGSGRLAGVDRARLDPLTGPDGRPLESKHEADAEGVAVWPDGDLMVSFERDHRIWIYPASGGPPHEAPIPDVAMPSNQGMEGLALASSQGRDAYWVGIEGGSIWLCRLKAACRQWSGLPEPPLGYRLTALAETPSGRLVIVHHSFNPLSAQSYVLVSIVDLPKTPRALAPIRAQLQLRPPQTVDNLEGVAAVSAPEGGLRLYLISDDNFSDKQRTLLLAFDWTGPGSGHADRRAARKPREAAP